MNNVSSPAGDEKHRNQSTSREVGTIFFLRRAQTFITLGFCFASCFALNHLLLLHPLAPLAPLLPCPLLANPCFPPLAFVPFLPHLVTLAHTCPTPLPSLALPCTALSSPRLPSLPLAPSWPALLACPPGLPSWPCLLALPPGLASWPLLTSILHEWH